MKAAVRQESQGGPVGPVMVLLAVAFWLVTRPYDGIFHDARLYALQALARLYPESLGQDVFLRYGSQDSFTLFSPLYAQFIAILGTEDAARVLTLAGQIWWFAALGWLALAVLGRSRGWLALAITAGLPGYYGAWEVFRFAEPFLTPRLFAEASVLTSIALTFNSRRLAAIPFVAAGLLLHPLIGAAGLLMYVGMVLPQRFRLLLPAGVVAGALLASLIAMLAPIPPLAEFDAEWLALVRMRSPFIHLTDWPLASWEVFLTIAVALAIFGSAGSDGPARKTFMTALAIAVLGILVTAIGSMFQVELLLQGQAWRWSWVAAALFGIAAVDATPTIWRSGNVARSAIGLFAVGWMLNGWPAILFVVLAALAWFLRARISGRSARALQLVSLALILSASYVWIWSLPTRSVESAGYAPRESLLRLAGFWLDDGVLPTAVALGVWFLATRYRHSRALVPVVAAAVAMVASVAIQDWFRSDYDDPSPEVTSAWLRSVPEQAEMLWPGDPAAPWLMLHRRNYMSMDQTAGILFSARAASEMLRRSREISLVQPPSLAFNAGSEGRFWTLSANTVRLTCERSSIDFIVSTENLGLPLAAPPLPVRHRVSGDNYVAYLHDCRTVSNP